MALIYGRCSGRGAIGCSSSRGTCGAPGGPVDGAAGASFFDFRLTQLPRPLNDNGAPTSLAGDFQEGGTRLAQEYLYDANGSVTQDRNKGITGIAYNHLNLPKFIHFGTGADSLVFRYSAAGQKVAKLVYQTGKPTLRTDYLGPFQYEQDSLRFFPHAEGRVLRFVNATSGAVRYAREFTFKDHLGNLRLAYRLGQRHTYTATMNLADATAHQRETHQFDSLSVSAPIATATYWARTGTYAARLNAGGTAPQPLGPLTQFAVQQGDTLRVTAPGLYPQATSNNSFAFSLASFVAALLNPAPGAPAGADGTRRGGLPLLQIGLNAAVLNALAQVPGGVPKGYLRVLSFNQDSVLVDQRTVQLSAAARGNYETLSTGPLLVQQNGYVSVYVGNESNADVYFDDVTIEHRQGLQVQETEYDPFGLDLAGVSGAAPGLRLKNFYQFNGKENQLDLGLNWNHQDWRFFDYQIGRWHVVDPEMENDQERWGPYSFGFDNAVRYSDADGRNPGGSGGGIIMPVYQPEWAIYQVGLGVMQTLGGIADRFTALFSTSTSTEVAPSSGGTVLGVGVKRTSTIEVKSETTIQPTLRSYLTPSDNSNQPKNPAYKVSTSVKMSKVEKIEGSGKYEGADVKASAAVKIDLKSGAATAVAETSAGVGVRKKGAAAAAFSLETNNKGESKAKAALKMDFQSTPKTKISNSVGIGFSF